MEDAAAASVRRPTEQAEGRHAVMVWPQQRPLADIYADIPEACSDEETAPTITDDIGSVAGLDAAEEEEDEEYEDEFEEEDEEESMDIAAAAASVRAGRPVEGGVEQAGKTRCVEAAADGTEDQSGRQISAESIRAQDDKTDDSAGSDEAARAKRCSPIRDSSASPSRPHELPEARPLFDFERLRQQTPPVPRTGTRFTMAHPGPHRLTCVPDAPEPLLRVPDDLLAHLVDADAARSLRTDLINRVVYDALDFAHNDASLGECGTAEERVVVYPEELKPYYTRADDADTTLVFESRFESGNLRRAIQVLPFEYDLVLKPDINTRGHTQWFYFSVSNVRAGQTYKFNIVNMVKPDSLYNYGMQPQVYSQMAAAASGQGWVRGGWNIGYFPNQAKRRGGGVFSTLSFLFTFKHDNDTVLFAHSVPYTYSDLQADLKRLECDPVIRTRFRRRALCQTLAGNTCDLLTITAFPCSPEALRQRRGIVITARVHPGEACSSWMCRGMIDYLTGSSADARILRDNFIFKIVPMLNPDGVVNGNTRCSLAGVDLNRTWQAPSRRLHPTITAAKAMIKRFSEDREVVLYVDLHAHSRKNNIFMYGCDDKSRPLAQRLGERVFPKLLSQNTPLFSFSDCSFRVQRSKESTARVVLWRELGIINSFTMEASFCGSAQANAHFNTQHLEQMGHCFCDAILDYCDPDQSKVVATMRELEAIYTARACDDEGSSAGSDFDERKRSSGGSGSRDSKAKVRRARTLGVRATGRRGSSTSLTSAASEATSSSVSMASSLTSSALASAASFPAPPAPRTSSPGDDASGGGSSSTAATVPAARRRGSGANAFRDVKAQVDSGLDALRRSRRRRKSAPAPVTSVTVATASRVSSTSSRNKAASTGDDQAGSKVGETGSSRAGASPPTSASPGSNAKRRVSAQASKAPRRVKTVAMTATRSRAPPPAPQVASKASVRRSAREAKAAGGPSGSAGRRGSAAAARSSNDRRASSSGTSAAPEDVSATAAATTGASTSAEPSSGAKARAPRQTSSLSDSIGAASPAAGQRTRSLADIASATPITASRSIAAPRSRAVAMAPSIASQYTAPCSTRSTRVSAAGVAASTSGSAGSISGGSSSSGGGGITSTSSHAGPGVGGSSGSGSGPAIGRKLALPQNSATNKSISELLALTRRLILDNSAADIGAPP